jgi:hypothetical protein
MTASRGTASRRGPGLMLNAADGMPMLVFADSVEAFIGTPKLDVRNKPTDEEGGTLVVLACGLQVPVQQTVEEIVATLQKVKEP